MNYLNSYIGSSTEEDTPSEQACYLLPGLMNHHTGASLSDDELVKCKREYNKWLSFFVKRRNQLEQNTMSEEEKEKCASNMKFWLSQMHACLQKIGQYTYEEMMKGFEVECPIS